MSGRGARFCRSLGSQRLSAGEGAGQFKGGTCPPEPECADPGEWIHSWKHYASCSSEFHYLTLGRLLDLLPAAFSNGSPTSMEPRSNLALSISLRLCVTESHGECGARFDETGRRRTAWARSQRPPARALPPETTLARVRREVGATVRCSGKVREMNVTVQVPDERILELLASGLSPTQWCSTGHRHHFAFVDKLPKGRHQERRHPGEGQTQQRHQVRRAV